MEKVLITGGSGFLGSYLVKAFEKEFETIGTYRKHRVEGQKTFYVYMDITDVNQTLRIIRDYRPDCVIHTAALTNVDYCEEHREEAKKINVEGTRNVALACEEVGAKLIYVSTDYVFDGEKAPYKEEDVPNPINYYAQTKLEGERIVQSLEIEYAIARISVPYGWHTPNQHKNYVTWLIEKLRNGQTVTIVTDQYNTPTLVSNAAEAILEIWKQTKSGRFHVCGKECINRFDFAIKVTQIFSLDKKLIQPITSEQLEQIAKRPKKSCLDITKAEKILKIKLLDINQGLLEMKKQKNNV